MSQEKLVLEEKILELETEILKLRSNLEALESR
jgi:hypothetical protein